MEQLVKMLLSGSQKAKPLTLSISYTSSDKSMKYGALGVFQYQD